MCSRDVLTNGNVLFGVENSEVGVAQLKLWARDVESMNGKSPPPNKSSARVVGSRSRRLAPMLGQRQKKALIASSPEMRLCHRLR